MKPIAAIVESAVEQHIAAVRKVLEFYREAQRHEQEAERRATKARDAMARMRIALGRELVAARTLWPARGPKAKGWGDFLHKVGVDQDVALDAMKYAGYVEEQFPGTEPGNLPDRLPTLAEAGIDTRSRAANDEEVQAPAADAAPEPDRDSWCTPKMVADAIGTWDLDPCSNERSHIKAKRAFRLDRGEDGLELANTIDEGARVFINCPYSRGQVLRWVRAYAHTRFCFLVKIDPSTEWFRELHDRTAIILAPIGERIEFEPPPGVVSSGGVQFPHGLFFANEDDASAHIKRLCFMWKTIHAA